MGFQTSSRDESGRCGSVLVPSGACSYWSSSCSSKVDLEAREVELLDGGQIRASEVELLARGRRFAASCRIAIDPSTCMLDEQSCTSWSSPSSPFSAAASCIVQREEETGADWGADVQDMNRSGVVGAIADGTHGSDGRAKAAPAWRLKMKDGRRIFIRRLQIRVWSVSTYSI